MLRSWTIWVCRRPKRREPSAHFCRGRPITRRIFEPMASQSAHTEPESRSHRNNHFIRPGPVGITQGQQFPGVMRLFPESASPDQQKKRRKSSLQKSHISKKSNVSFMNTNEVITSRFVFHFAMVPMHR